MEIDSWNKLVVDVVNESTFPFFGCELSNNIMSLYYVSSKLKFV